jgi:hypothetical protein
LSYLQQRRGIDFEVVLASSMFLEVGAICVMAAQLVVRRLEGLSMDPLLFVTVLALVAIEIPIAAYALVDRFYAPRR